MRQFNKDVYLKSKLHSFDDINDASAHSKITVTKRNNVFIFRSSVGESQFDSGNWSESVHTGVQEDEELTRGHKLK